MERLIGILKPNFPQLATNLEAHKTKNVKAFVLLQNGICIAYIYEGSPQMGRTDICYLEGMEIKSKAIEDILKGAAKEYATKVGFKGVRYGFENNKIDYI